MKHLQAPEELKVKKNKTKKTCLDSYFLNLWILFRNGWPHLLNPFIFYAILKGAPPQVDCHKHSVVPWIRWKGGLHPKLCPGPSMGKLLTSLPVLAFLSVLKACISCRDCVHIHTLLAFAFPLPHCLALACARNDVMVAVCICQSHLTCFMFVQAIVTLEGSRGKHIFSCLKDRWKVFTKDPSFTLAILGSTWEQEVHSLSGQRGTGHY